MIEDLNKLFKKYVAIFINEYSDYLSKDQLEVLKSINYDNIIIVDNLSKPLGIVSLGRVHLPSENNEIFDNFKKMPNFNSKKNELSNKNMKSYLKYMCDNGYEINDFYRDILMYSVFNLVIKNASGMINGLINQEVRYLSIKYSLKIANLFPREETIVEKIAPIIGVKGCRRIIFLDSASSFKYLNDNYGFRIAKLLLDLDELIDEEYKHVSLKEYPGNNGMLDYVEDYDHLLYGDAYNCILDFETENSLTN